MGVGSGMNPEKKVAGEKSCNVLGDGGRGEERSLARTAFGQAAVGLEQSASALAWRKRGLLLEGARRRFRGRRLPPRHRRRDALQFRLCWSAALFFGGKILETKTDGAVQQGDSHQGDQGQAHPGRCATGRGKCAGYDYSDKKVEHKLHGKGSG